MKKALALVLVLTALLTPAVFASDAELSDIDRPVDAEAEEEQSTQAYTGAPMEEQPVLVEVIRHEAD
jgi:hypothetical protein